MRSVWVGLAMAGLLLPPAPAQAVVLCAKRKGSAIKPGAPLRLRPTCLAGEVTIDPDGLGLRGPTGNQGPMGAPGEAGPPGPVGPRQHSLPVESATALNGAVYELNGGGDLTGLVLPNTGFPRFAVGMTLPADFVPGTNVAIRIVWGNSRFNATSCGFRLESNSVIVHRPGGGSRGGLATFPGGDSGIDLQAPAVSEQLSETTMTIAGSSGGTPTLQPGDMLSLIINRRPDDPQDTCTGKLFILGAVATW
jgi:hypothetical protein